jgi:hypothetical protein
MVYCPLNQQTCIMQAEWTNGRIREDPCMLFDMESLKRYPSGDISSIKDQIPSAATYCMMKDAITSRYMQDLHTQ